MAAFMCVMTSLSKHFAAMGVSATGLYSFRLVT